MKSRDISVRDRAHRRSLSLRYKKRALERLLKPAWRAFTKGPKITDREIGMRARTRVPCSCYYCGHRREWYGETPQEKRAND